MGGAGVNTPAIELAPEWPDLIGGGQGITVGLDPTVKEAITELQKELAHQTDMACQAHVCGELRVERLQEEIAGLKEKLQISRLHDETVQIERDALHQALSGRTVSCGQCNTLATENQAMREAIREAQKSFQSIYLDDIFDLTMKEIARAALAKLQPFLK
jgi:hypothetical protein